MSKIQMGNPPIGGYAVAPQNIGDNKKLKVITRVNGRKRLNDC